MSRRSIRKIRSSALVVGLLSLSSACGFLAAEPEADGSKDILVEARETITLGKKYAIVVGISRYSESSLNLKAASRDATAMADFLKQPDRTGGYEVKLLLNDDATRIKLAEVLLEVKDSAGPRDTVIFFYSGHGFIGRNNEPYLFPTDGRRRLLEDTAYSLRKVFRMINETQAKQKVLFLDCCHSGALGESLLASAKGTEDVRVSEEALQKLSEGTGLVIVSSSRGDQLSWEDTGPDGSGLGFFTKYLLGGLQGAADGSWGEGRGNFDGVIDVRELVEYVYYKANAEVKAKHDRPQQATLSGYMSGPIHLALVPENSGPSIAESSIPAGKGLIQLKSRPAGALIYVDGDPTHQFTPSEIVLGTGSHNVRLGKPGCLDWEGSIAVAPGINEVRWIDLLPGAESAGGKTLKPKDLLGKALELEEVGHFEEAFKLLREAADQADARAQTHVGLCYSLGRGVPKDDGEAVRWFEKAAELGFAKGQNLLGMMYAEGRGVPRDSDKAFELFRKSAEKGDSRGTFYLGLMYHRGQGSKKDSAKALELCSQAAKEGDPEARRWLVQRGMGW